MYMHYLLSFLKGIVRKRGCWICMYSSQSDTTGNTCTILSIVCLIHFNISLSVTSIISLYFFLPVLWSLPPVDPLGMTGGMLLKVPLTIDYSQSSQ